MKTFTTFALLLTLLAAVGCQTTNRVERANPRSDANYVKDSRITTDPELNQIASIVSINEAQTDGGLLKLQVQVLNNTFKRQRFNYRFDWIDSAGMIMDTHMASWKQMSLAGQEIGVITAIGPSPKAVDFRLQMTEINAK